MGQQLSSGIKFPYKKGHKVWEHSPNNEYSLSLFDGEDNNTSAPVSIFSIQPTQSQLASNYFKRIKTIKHPNLLSMINGTVVENEASYYIVTEKVRPLRNALKDLLTYPDSIAWGLYQISRALGFLNGQGLVHGDISIDSIFVDTKGDWKLGGFQMISEVSSIKDGSSFFSHRYCRDSTLNIQWSPEIENNNLSTAENFSIDSWLLGCLIFSIFNYHDIGDIHQFERNRLKNTTNLPLDIKKDYIKLLRGSGKQRMPAQDFLASPYFEKDLVEICLFLETLSIKEQYEKDRFCKTLTDHIDEFPKLFVTKKILPSLVSALDYGMVGSDYLPIILKILKKSKNSDPKFPSSIIKWWSFNDRILRIQLLENVDMIMDYLTEKDVSESIWPHYVTGFTDTHSHLRDLTVKALIAFAPKLKPNILNDDMLKYLAKTQSDQEPGIRTNTTICVGKVCEFIKEATRKKIIIPAFGRALKDTYPPARKAGVNGFKYALTMNYLQPLEVATKILPLISPLSLDRDESVREAALETMQSFIEFLNQNSETMSKVQQQEQK